MDYWQDCMNGYLTGRMIDKNSRATHFIIRAEGVLWRPEMIYRGPAKLLPQTEAQKNSPFHSFSDSMGSDPSLGKDLSLSADTWNEHQRWVIHDYLRRLTSFEHHGNVNDILDYWQPEPPKGLHPPTSPQLSLSPLPPAGSAAAQSTSSDYMKI